MRPSFYTFKVSRGRGAYTVEYHVDGRWLGPSQTYYSDSYDDAYTVGQATTDWLNTPWLDHHKHHSSAVREDGK